MNWKNRFLHSLPLALFALAMWIIWHELRHIQFQDVRQAMDCMPKWRLAVALVMTLLNYVVLIGYDWTAVRAIDCRLPLRQVAMASFAGFAISNNVSALFGGTAVRYRYYSQWGLSAVELFRLILMIGITFWMGLLMLAGIMMVVEPIELPAPFSLSPTVLWLVGWGLLLLTLAYVALVALRKRPIQLRGMDFQLPGLPITLLQLLIAALDLSMASGVLYVLLGSEVHVSFPHFLAVYLLAMVIVMFSHVPGGVGVFELVVIAGLGTQADPAMIAALLLFRVIYYLAPLAIAMAWMAAYEFAQNRSMVLGQVSKHGAQTWGQLKHWWPSLAPSFIALGVFVAGALLLVSGATPAESHRLSWLMSWVPLPLMELSHFLGSLIGVALLLLAHGLQRRLDTAFWTTIVLLLAGISFSLLKGWDYEEAIFLSLVLAALAPCHQAFYRRGRWLTADWSFAWLGPTLLVVMCSIWIGLFVNKHVEYRDELWWQFAFNGDAPRFLRATIGVISGLLVMGVFKLLAPHKPPEQLPTPAEVDRATQLADSSNRASAQLVRLGDKQLLFSAAGDAVIMYGRQGRSWIAMGDPIGPSSQWSELVWGYREMVDRHAGWPVFYQVSTEALPVYLDQGLTLLKIGEEARVDLSDFSLEGPARRGLRQTINRLQREQVTFEVAPASDYAAHAPRLKEISQAWLADKQAHEKGFSLGFFDDRYLAHYSMALVRQRGEIVAFANIWSSGQHQELSPDLMRYLPTAPSSVMEYLFTELMLWGKAQGYHWFSLGMAPLSGIEARKLAPIWNRMTNMVYRHGEHFYSFDGLRRYKDKFDPTWSSKYLAVPGGAALPLILTDVTRLISRHR